MELVCCSLIYEGELREYWLLNPEEKKRLKSDLLKFREEGKALVCFNATAEGRGLLTLGLDVRKFKWLDIQVEYKMLLNHWTKFRYGKQYIDGKYKVTSPPRYNKKYMTEEDKKKYDSSQPKSNLLACTYKMLGSKVDSAHKDKMRDLILTADIDLIENNKKAILDYCSSDVEELLDIWDKIKEAYRDYFSLPERKKGMVKMEEVYFRGDTVARTAIMQWTGYPVNFNKLKNLSLNAPIIMREMIEDINSQFDWPLFSPNKSKIGYKQNQKEWKEFIVNSEYASKWTLTEKGSISLKLDAFTSKFSHRHDYPKGDFFAQAIRFLKTRQVLNGLTPSASAVKKKDTIFDAIGSDSRVRYFPNSYGGQSSRYQPPAKSFIFLKPAWMRGVVEAPKGRAIVSIDYKSEEALIGALNSNDPAAIQAYKSGDVYLDFAKRAKAVPEDATKDSHKEMRDLFKSTYLGISYLMGAEALGRKLTNDTGKLKTKEDAQELIDAFYAAYPQYKEYLDTVVYTYNKKGYLKSSDGWVLFGDNPNFRSVSNWSIQTQGSCILRRAISLAQDAGLTVIFGLHDAVYVEYDAGDFKTIDTLARCMEQAFIDLYPNNPDAKLIRLDIDSWSTDYSPGKITTPEGREVELKDIYIDPRAKKEYEQFSKYMEGE